MAFPFVLGRTLVKKSRASDCGKTASNLMIRGKRLVPVSSCRTPAVLNAKRQWRGAPKEGKHQQRQKEGEARLSCESNSCQELFCRDKNEAWNHNLYS